METIRKNAVASANGPIPLVSIVCLTFNQEKYIAQAIESFVSQETSFPFEIIIHDDASIDRTLEIVKKYQVRHPELITVIAQSENLYSKGNHLPALVFRYARGAFIAYCEGDDYWCDSHKIRRQAEFLLNNPQHGVVFTNSRVLYEEENRLVPGKDRSALSDLSSEHAKALLLLGNPYTSCTAMLFVMSRSACLSGKTLCWAVSCLTKQLPTKPPAPVIAIFILRRSPDSFC